MKIDNEEDLDVVMLMYNLLEYSKNYKKTTGSLWNYYRDEQVYREILMLVLMKKGMMQIKLIKMKLKLLFH